MKRALPLILLALTASPALAQNQRVWGYDGGEHPVLYFAIPDSDDVSVTFHCDAGEGVVRILTFVDHAIAVGNPREDGKWLDAKGRPEPWPAKMTLASGGVTVSVAAQARSDEMSGGSTVEARLPVTAPVLAAFRKTGSFNTLAFGQTQALSGAPGKDVEALLRDCAKR